MPTSAREPARRIAELVADSDLGFLFARLAVDGVEEGGLDPKSPDFARTLRLPVVELLTRVAGPPESEAPRAALLQALALAPDPGLPLGDVWRTLALAMAEPGDELEQNSPQEEVPRWAGAEAQLRVLTHFRRFVIEDRLEGETVYRWFHPAIRDALREEAGGVRSERFRRSVGALLDLRDIRAGDWEEPERVGHFLLEALPRMLIEAADEQLFARALQGVPEYAGSRLIADLCNQAAGRRSGSDTLDPARWAIAATRGRGDGLEAMATVTQVASEGSDRFPPSEVRHQLIAAIAKIEEILKNEPNRVDLLKAGVRGCRMLALTPEYEMDDAETGLAWIRRIMQRVAAADPPARAAVGPAVAELLESYSDSLGEVVGPGIQAETAGASADLRQLLLQAGRADLLIPYARSLDHGWRASESLGHPGSLSRFHDSVLAILATGATDPDWMVETMALVGELSQGLALAGRGVEALDVLDRTVAAGAPELGDDSPDPFFGFGLANVLSLRSSVNAGLGESERALADALGALEIERLLMDRGSHRARGTRSLGGPRILEANLTMRVAEGRLAGDPVASSFSGPLFLSKTENRYENWAADFLLTREELTQESAAAAARRAETALDEMDPGSPRPPSKPDSLAFVTFGVELQLGVALRDAHEMLEDPARARAALPLAATIFLRNQIESAPSRLLHLEPHLREQTADALRMVISEHPEFRHRESDWLGWLKFSELDDGDALPESLTLTELDTAETRYLQASFAFEASRELGWPRREVAAVAQSLIATLGPPRYIKTRDDRPENRH